MPENAGGASLDESSPSLEAVIGEFYGDYNSSAEPEPDVGAPPAEVSDTPSTEEAAAPSETPAPDAPTEPASDPAVPTTDETDPLEGAVDHLAYVVNGEQRKLDGITVLKDGRAIVDSPDALQRLTRIIGERDNLFERQREQHQQFDSLSKLTAWTPPGATAPLTGRDAITALHASRAELLAEVKAYQTLLSNPENLRDILVPNEDGSLGWNQLGVRAFLAELKNTQGNVRQAISKHFADNFPTQSAPAAPAPFDPQALADVAIQATGVTGLNDADTQWAKALAPRFIRLATAQDTEVNPSLRVGAPMVEQQFIDLVRERQEMRAATAKTVSSAADVAKANAAKLAAAAQGKKPATNPPVIKQTPEPERTRDDDFASAWDLQEKAAAGALRAHAAGVRR